MNKKYKMKVLGLMMMMTTPTLGDGNKKLMIDEPRTRGTEDEKGEGEKKFKLKKFLCISIVLLCPCMGKVSCLDAESYRISRITSIIIADNEDEGDDCSFLKESNDMS